MTQRICFYTQTKPQLKPKLAVTLLSPLSCHVPPLARTSGDLGEELLPGDDPAQPVAGASAVMVHSQVDILGLRGHAPETLAARGLRELPEHH